MGVRLSYREKAEQMADGVRRQQLGWYARNCACSPAAGLLHVALLEWASWLKGEKGAAHPDFFSKEQLSEAERAFQELSCVLEQYAAMPPNEKDNLERTVIFARQELGLDGIDAEILLLLLRYEWNRALEEFADNVLQHVRSPVAAMAALTGIGFEEAIRRLSVGSPLVDGGLVCPSEYKGSYQGLAGRSGHFQLSLPVRKVMHASFVSHSDWVEALVGPPLASSLRWEDFAHLAAPRDLAAKVMGSAARTGARGANLLLHGAVGTGKTEFAKVLAAHAGMRIWSVGETDDDSNEPSRTQRLASLKLAQQLLGKRGDALILLDESDDVLAATAHSFGFPGRSRLRDHSKVYLNRLLDQNAVPIVWACNAVDDIDPSVLRRMTFAVEFRPPNRSVRARIWRRVADEAGLMLGAGTIDRLAGRYHASPAVAANAARVAALSGGGEPAIEQAMESILRLLGTSTPPDLDPCAFDLGLVNCRDDLATLVDGLTRPGASRQWSLCICGPSGTGKSLFARHLAGRLGMEVVQKRASDLLSRWVGDSEKAIAEAFRSARSSNAMLVVDEADSLLSDRRRAAQTWQVSQINEMLTWMESHSLPFICTTNLPERLDQASLRRFTFKVTFETLDPAQTERAFERFFHCPAPRRLADGLTAGDFATVRRKRELLGVSDPRQLTDWLNKEAEARGAPVRPIGFAIAHD